MEIYQSGELVLGPPLGAIFFRACRAPKNKRFTLRNHDLGFQNRIFRACGAPQTDDLPLEIGI